MNKKIDRILPHITIIMSLWVGTLWVLDQLNPLMGFMDCFVSNTVQIVFCFLVLIHGILRVWQQCGEKGTVLIGLPAPKRAEEADGEGKGSD